MERTIILTDVLKGYVTKRTSFEVIIDIITCGD